MSATIPVWWMVVLVGAWIAVLLVTYEVGYIVGYRKALKDALHVTKGVLGEYLDLSKDVDNASAR